MVLVRLSKATTRRSHLCCERIFQTVFNVEKTAEMSDGSVFYFADPENRFVVFEREGRKSAIDLVAATLVVAEERVVQDPGNTLSFFITSKGVGNGAHLGGLAGADRHCKALAEAVGEGDKTWRAYLSTSIDGEPAINAGDRIGSGPWHNTKGIMVARGVADLHEGNFLSKEMSLDETGAVINGRGDDPNRHDILTGTLSDGTAAVGMKLPPTGPAPVRAAPTSAITTVRAGAMTAPPGMRPIPPEAAARKTFAGPVATACSIASPCSETGCCSRAR